jgi:hypothetical protein
VSLPNVPLNLQVDLWFLTWVGKLSSPQNELLMRADIQPSTPHSPLLALSQTAAHSFFHHPYIVISLPITIPEVLGLHH